MGEPSIRKPTGRAFHVPKNADGHAKAGDRQAKEANAPATEAVDATAARAKVAKRKQTATVEEAQAGPTTEVKAKRTKKGKVVRDSFTMPKSDYEKIAVLKQKCLDAGVSVKKSELLRAGLLLLEASASKRLLAAISEVETVKTGRPTKS